MEFSLSRHFSACQKHSLGNLFKLFPFSSPKAACSRTKTHRRNSAVNEWKIQFLSEFIFIKSFKSFLSLAQAERKNNFMKILLYESRWKHTKEMLLAYSFPLLPCLPQTQLKSFMKKKGKIQNSIEWQGDFFCSDLFAERKNRKKRN